MSEDQNPKEIFRAELEATALFLAKEMREAREGKILQGEDKTFERIAVLLKEGAKIMEGLTRKTDLPPAPDGKNNPKELAL